MKQLAMTCLVLLLAACASQKMQKDHGVSTENNIANQVTNPQAETQGSTAAGMEGIAAGDAMRAYKEADNENRGERLVQDLVD